MGSRLQARRVCKFCYTFDTEDLKILYLNSEEYCILHWLALLLKNRNFDVKTALSKAAKEYIIENFSIDTSSYDVIVGYRADDSYFSYADDFIKMDILHFVERLDQVCHEERTITRLKAYRQMAGLSQRELAEKTEIPIRTIQQYEQRQKNINKAQVDYLISFSKVLYCEPEDLLE